jgi:hypothetical protein
MTDINHRRKNRKPVALRHNTYRNGYSIPASRIADEARPTMHEIENTDPTESYQRVGRTRYLDKSLHGWGNLSKFADKQIGASISNDFTNGHRGMAKAVRGAKKFVRSRTRFHENAETKKMKGNYLDSE